MSDLDVLKEIPGYKAILKSVLKSQIHLLMEQLSEHTGEESIILTASVHDGSLSHLGSNTGKGFLEGRDEIKSQFLGYCLKTYHKKKTHEPQKPYQRTHPSPRSPAQLPTPPAKRPRPQPVSLSMTMPIDTYSQSNIIPTEISDSNVGFGNSGAMDNSTVSVKTEQIDNESEDISQQELSDSAATSTDKSIPESVHLTHTQTSSAENDYENMEDNAEAEKTDVSDLTTIKVEQVEDELEITGVEMAAGNLDNWSQGQHGYGESDTSFDQSAEQASYNPAYARTLMHQNSATNTGSQLKETLFKQSESMVLPHDFAIFKNITQHVCPYCKKIFGKKTDMNRHVLIHTGDKPHKCDICDKDFRLMHHLKQHKFSVHKTVD